MHNLIDPEQNGVAIIVGCWQQHVLPEVLACHRRITQVIDQMPPIQAVILSANHCELADFQQGPNAWYDTAHRMFYLEQGVSWVRDLWQQPPENAFATPSHHIRDHDWQGRPCIALWQQAHFEWLLTHEYTNVSNIWWFGVGWNAGVMHDPLGWGPTCDLIRFQHVPPRNMLVHDQCVLSNLSTPTTRFTEACYGAPDFAAFSWQPLQDHVYHKTDLSWSHRA